jgi:uroporphyrin-III C-methyltransferase
MNRTWRSPGKVFLVGAGPGDPRFLTVMGAEVLRLADVVVHDDLVSAETLDLAKPGALMLRAGKRAGRPSAEQHEINAALVEHARLGRLVVRLKGGDPFVFGRGGEEAEALERAGIEWEVVPGVSSGVAVPARAGIPVTHRELASSVLFVTAEESAAKGRGPVDWSAVARAADTIVVFMCARSASSVASRLLEGGRSASTPVAVVSHGTSPCEQVHLTTLGELAEAIARRFEAPSIAVVGEVAAFPTRLAALREIYGEVAYDEFVA